MEKVRIVIGSPVRGREFWNRERELKQVWKALETSSVLLTAPRRFGKTSLMQHLVDHPQNGWQAFYFDAEGLKQPECFVAELTIILLREQKFRHLLDKAKKIIGNLSERVDEVSFGEFKISIQKQLASDWQEKGRELIELSKELKLKTIFIIDELPLLIGNIAKEQGEKSARELLSWLRSLRQMPDLRHKVRWVTGGSIGIEKVLQRVGAGTKEINDLERIHVREFTQDLAREFIKALLNSEGISPVSDRILRKFLSVVGIPIPYFIQILVRESLNEMVHSGKNRLSEKMIEQAYENGVLASYNRTYFEHYYERLQNYYSPDIASVAKALLTEIAKRETLAKTELWTQFKVQTQGRGDEDTFSYLISDLENDFYLVREGDQFRFATKVLRDWWLRYHAHDKLITI